MATAPPSTTIVLSRSPAWVAAGMTSLPNLNAVTAAPTIRQMATISDTMAAMMRCGECLSEAKVRTQRRRMSVTAALGAPEAGAEAEAGAGA